MVKTALTLTRINCINLHNYFKALCQKKNSQNIMGARSRDSCRGPFKSLKIVPLTSQFIFSLALFVVNSKTLFEENSEVHNIKNRNNSNLFQPSSHLMIYQNEPFILASRCITIFHLKQGSYRLILSNSKQLIGISYKFIFFYT